MKRLCLGLLALLLLCAGLALAEEAFDPDDIDPAAAEFPKRLTGVVIGIDAGHQAHGNNEKEPVAPGSSEKKAKVSSGTSGVKSRIAEYVVNLDVSLKLQQALEEEGATVVMARTENDVDISNVERAQMMNENGVQLFLRIHCNGVDIKSKNGIGLYVRKEGGQVADKAYEAAKIMMPCLLESTGANEDGIFRRDNYSGLNWAEMPSILVEMGYMSNPEEDLKLTDPAYQDRMVEGMVEGICQYFESQIAVVVLPDETEIIGE